MRSFNGSRQSGHAGLTFEVRVGDRNLNNGMFASGRGRRAIGRLSRDPVLASCLSAAGKSRGTNRAAGKSSV